MGAGAVRNPPPPEAAATDTHAEPRDARVVREILRSAGLREGDYDPAVVQQFLILAYRYAADVLGDALVYAHHAGRASLEADDVRLAIQSNAMFSAQPPRRELILSMAHSRNEIPIPIPRQLITPNKLHQVEETEDDDDDHGKIANHPNPPDQAAPVINPKKEQDHQNRAGYSRNRKHRRRSSKKVVDDVPSRLNAVAAARTREKTAIANKMSSLINMRKS